jgi:hypothetical protein
VAGFNIINLANMSDLTSFKLIPNTSTSDNGAFPAVSYKELQLIIGLG